MYRRPVLTATTRTCPDTWSPEGVAVNCETSSVSSDCHTTASESLDGNDDSESTEGSSVSDTQRRRLVCPAVP